MEAEAITLARLRIERLEPRFKEARTLVRAEQVWLFLTERLTPTFRQSRSEKLPDTAALVRIDTEDPSATESMIERLWTECG